MAAWLASSNRFTAFVTTYQTKIRKKIRTAQKPDSLRDLQLELETAYLLLRERVLSLEYEPQLREHTRSPDFAVTCTTSLTFMVEITRLRADSQHIPTEVQAQPLITPMPETMPTIALGGERLTAAICSKLGQLLPQRSNALLIGVDALRLTSGDLRTIMLRIQQRAERNDAMFLQRHRFGTRADFFQHYQRLSEILVRGVPLQAGEPMVAWVNPQAKQPLPSKVRTALFRSHTL
jgi:hypothetical protein